MIAQALALFLTLTGFSTIAFSSAPALTEVQIEPPPRLPPAPYFLSRFVVRFDTLEEATKALESLFASDTLMDLPYFHTLATAQKNQFDKQFSFFALGSFCAGSLKVWHDDGKYIVEMQKLRGSFPLFHKIFKLFEISGKTLSTEKTAQLKALEPFPAFEEFPNTPADEDEDEDEEELRKAFSCFIWCEYLDVNLDSSRTVSDLSTQKKPFPDFFLLILSKVFMEPLRYQDYSPKKGELVKYSDSSPIYLDSYSRIFLAMALLQYSDSLKNVLSVNLEVAASLKQTLLALKINGFKDAKVGADPYAVDLHLKYYGEQLLSLLENLPLPAED